MMSIYRSFCNFFQPGYIKRGVLDWVVITMPEAVPGHFCEFVQMSCINYLVWARPRRSAQRYYQRSYSKNTHFRRTVRSICPRAVLGNLPCLHGRADTFFPASNSRRMPGKPPRLSPQTPQPDSEDVSGPSHTTTVLMHYLLYTVLTYYILIT